MTKPKKKQWKCLDCDYIGNKEALQDHVIATEMEHKMALTKPKKKPEWERSLRFALDLLYNMGAKQKNHSQMKKEIISDVQKAINKEASKRVKEALGKMERAITDAVANATFHRKKQFEERK